MKTLPVKHEAWPACCCCSTHACCCCSTQRAQPPDRCCCSTQVHNARAHTLRTPKHEGRVVLLLFNTTRAHTPDPQAQDVPPAPTRFVFFRLLLQNPCCQGLLLPGKSPRQSVTVSQSVSYFTVPPAPRSPLRSSTVPVQRHRGEPGHSGNTYETATRKPQEPTSKPTPPTDSRAPRAPSDHTPTPGITNSTRCVEQHQHEHAAD